MFFSLHFFENSRKKKKSYNTDCYGRVKVKCNTFKKRIKIKMKQNTSSFNSFNALSSLNSLNYCKKRKYKNNNNQNISINKVINECSRELLLLLPNYPNIEDIMKLINYHQIRNICKYYKDCNITSLNKLKIIIIFHIIFIQFKYWISFRLGLCKFLFSKINESGNITNFLESFEEIKANDRNVFNNNYSQEANETPQTTIIKQTENYSQYSDTLILNNTNEKEVVFGNIICNNENWVTPREGTNE